MHLSRRDFFGAAGALALGFNGLHTLLDRLASGAGTAVERYGPLVTDPRGVLSLPNGFTYTIISRTGDTMDDGFRVPALADGMATFAGLDGRTIIVRNHEVSAGASPASGPFGAGNEMFSRISPASIYDAGRSAGPCLGGTTTLVYDTGAGRLVSQHLSLVGTLRNCAGGPTPWGSWVTCEETIDRAGEICARDHGYCFEVPASAPGLAEPVPLKAMGRFNHEAIAVDPASGVVYLTEDRGDSLLYRFIPNRAERLAEGGRLQALAFVGRPSLDTRNWGTSVSVPVGRPYKVRWIDLDDVEAPIDDLRYRGFDAGAARFARGEGMWYGNDAVYFACTNGGVAQNGQIWRYIPSPDEGRPEEEREPAQVELFVEPNDRTVVENADNLTVAPWGDLIVCEDSSGDNFLVGVTPDGELYKFGHNALNDSEFAGATFSPDGSTLFVNIQTPGMTLAITGPWRT